MYIITSRLLRNIIQKKDVKGGTENALFEEKVYELKNLSNFLFNKIDPSLRVKMMKRGVNLQLNTNAGYDTEYNGDNEDSTRNIQVSTQLAVSSHILLRIPLNVVYEFGGVETLRGGTYQVKMKSKCVDFARLLMELQ